MARINGTEYVALDRTNNNSASVRDLLGRKYGLDNRQITDLLSELHGKAAPAVIQFHGKNEKAYILRHDGFQSFTILERESDH